MVVWNCAACGCYQTGDACSICADPNVVIAEGKDGKKMVIRVLKQDAELEHDLSATPMIPAREVS